MNALSQVEQYITFRLGSEVFAVNVAHVREVLDLTPITKVPTAPRCMRGVVNVRGSAIPVLDLRQRFGMSAVEETVNTRILVLELEIEDEVVVVGGIADSVHEVIELDPSQVVPPPTVAMRWRADFIKGIGKRGDEFIIMLDLATVFSETELTTSAVSAGEAAA